MLETFHIHDVIQCSESGDILNLSRVYKSQGYFLSSLEKSLISRCRTPVSTTSGLLPFPLTKSSASSFSPLSLDSKTVQSYTN